jgi:hypothetical protein
MQNGLEVDFNACHIGELIDAAGTSTVVSQIGGERVERKHVSGFFFCPAIYRQEIDGQAELNPVFESAFDKIEDACPHLFPPRGRTTCITGLCFRGYPLNDNQLTIRDNGDVNFQRYPAFDDPFLGKAEVLARDPAKVHCHNEFGRYVPWSPGANMFSRPQPPSQ